MEINHLNEENHGRFVVSVNGKEAGYLKYKILENGNLNANGTLVYDEFKDQKLGKPLFDAFIDYVKENHLKVFPTCPYIVVMFKKHPELSHLLADDYHAS